MSWGGQSLDLGYKECLGCKNGVDPRMGCRLKCDFLVGEEALDLVYKESTDDKNGVDS